MLFGSALKACGGWWVGGGYESNNVVTPTRVELRLSWAVTIVDYQSKILGGWLG